MKTKTLFLLIAISASFFFRAQAQQELSTHFLRSIDQASYSNPAFMTDHKFGINLTSYYLNFYNTGFAANDILFDIPGTDSLRLDLDPVISSIGPDDNFQFDINLDILFLTFRTKNAQFSLNYGIKNLAYVQYNRELVDVVWNGNGNYIGETIEIAPDFQTFSYQEIGFGAAFNIKDKINVGGRLKLLSGIADISAANPNQRIALTTDPDIFQLTLNTDYIINSSGFPELDSNYTPVNDEDIFDFFFSELSFFENFGFAIDLGVEIQVNDKLTVAASAIDIGAVEWSRNVYNYESQGEFFFDGIDLDPLLDGDTLDFSSIGDTLRDIFDIQSQVSSKSYTSMLPSKFYLSGRYEISSKLTVNGLFYVESFRETVTPGIALGANYQVAKPLNIGTVVALRNNRITNLGLNAVLHAGPVQLFASSDNILPVFRPFGSQNFNIRGGLNLVFGKVGQGRSNDETIN